jgi:HAD superfamily hydrolase (TIGR01549 family)
MPDYTCIIFDVDGTLINTESAILFSLQKVLQEETLTEIPLGQLQFALGIPGEVALRQLGIQNVAEINALWNDIFQTMYDKINVFNGIEKTLIALQKEGITTGIVTSKTKEELHHDFKYFSLEKYFSYIVCADDTEKHKPEPDPILKFLEMSGTDRRTTMYVGDTVYDMQCARGAGVGFRLALWGAKSCSFIQEKYLLKQPEDILKLLHIS